MIKVDIITIHDPDVNYGSTLQSCGTYNFVSKMGYQVEIINYKPQYKTLKKRIMIMLSKAAFFRFYIIRRRKVNKYFEEHGCLSPKYNTYKQLLQDTPQADIYITGSDVIWNRDINPEGGDLAYYLGFVKDKPRISYAPSMGEPQSIENILFIKEQIEKFAYISVREDYSKEQLNSVGLSNVYTVLDPVFLMDREYYIKQINKNNYGRYSLVYLMSSSKEKGILVESITRFFENEVIGIGGFKKKCKCNKYIRDAGIEDFLSLIYYSDFIVTDSFHCVAFSIIFKKQFVYVPSVDSSMRIENLLNYVDLSDRIITKEEEFTNISRIDYDKVDKKLNHRIEYSREFLRAALKNCSH